MSGLVPFNHKRGSLINSGFGDFYNVLDDFFTESWPTTRNLIGDTFKVDVIEQEDKYEVVAEVPGFKKEEINLSIEEGKLTIAINHEENIEEKDENRKYIHREIKRCSMSRSIYLKDIDTDQIEAKLDNGILRLEIPKLQQIDSKRTIEIH